MSTAYTWRAATYADLPSLYALLVAAAEADAEPRLPSLADLQREFEDEWSPVETDTRVALAPDGTLAAFGRLFTNPRPTDTPSPAPATEED